MKDVEAIIFDFGNVIINIDVSRTIRQFAALTRKPEDKIRSRIAESELFRKYESGFYTDDEFRDVVRQLLEYPLNDDEIDTAWNALLLDVPAHRLEMLRMLRTQRPVYLLSNTNSIHIQECKHIFKREFGVSNFLDLFDFCFLSYEMKQYKPDYGIYATLLEKIGKAPSKILFLDDNADNIHAAEDLGIQTIHIRPPECFSTILKPIFDV